jgi:hypothetical protein
MLNTWPALITCGSRIGRVLPDASYKRLRTDRMVRNLRLMRSASYFADARYRSMIGAHEGSRSRFAVA